MASTPTTKGSRWDHELAYPCPPTSPEMRLLKIEPNGKVKLSKEFYDDEIPPYAILSHTWSSNEDDEVSFNDFEQNTVDKASLGYKKIQLCATLTAKDGLSHFWVDSACIDRRSSAQVSEAINSMFEWYEKAFVCYVYLSDVLIRSPNWLRAFRQCKWFTRGWTLQELLAPRVLEFYDQDGQYMGSAQKWLREIHKITAIPMTALQGATLSKFTIDERMRWAECRNTKRGEDKAYCLLGIFGVTMPMVYGEKADRAFVRLKAEIRSSAVLPDSDLKLIKSLPAKAIESDKLDDLPRPFDSLRAEWSQRPSHKQPIGRLRKMFSELACLDEAVPHAHREIDSFANQLAKFGKHTEDWYQSPAMAQIFGEVREIALLVEYFVRDRRRRDPSGSLGGEIWSLKDRQRMMLLAARLRNASHRYLLISHEERHRYEEEGHEEDQEQEKGEEEEEAEQEEQEQEQERRVSAKAEPAARASGSIMGLRRVRFSLKT